MRGGLVRAKGLDAMYELRQRFIAGVAAGRLELARGGAHDPPDAVTDADPSTLGAVL